MNAQVIPAAYIDAAAKAYLLADGTMPAYYCMLKAIPHILEGLVATLDAQVTHLENTPVEEHEYPALCAQREALVGVMQILSPTK